jgi:serine/threonine protein kinase
MEAINGVSLREILSHNPPLGPEAALTVLKGALLGMAAAHAARVVPRDYKPANVVVEGNGNSKLIDFGIAGLTGEGAVAHCGYQDRPQRDDACRPGVCRGSIRGHPAQDQVLS